MRGVKGERGRLPAHPAALLAGREECSAVTSSNLMFIWYFGSVKKTENEKKKIGNALRFEIGLVRCALVSPLLPRHPGAGVGVWMCPGMDACVGVACMAQHPFFECLWGLPPSP